MRLVLPLHAKLMMGKRKAFTEPVTDKDIITEVREYFGTVMNAARIEAGEEEYEEKCIVNLYSSLYALLFEVSETAVVACFEAVT